MRQYSEMVLGGGVRDVNKGSSLDYPLAERRLPATLPSRSNGQPIYLGHKCPRNNRLSGALESVSDTMHDVCNASLYKNSIVPTSNDTIEPENVLN